MDNNALQKHTDAIRKAEDHISQSIQKMCDDIKSVEDEILRKNHKTFANFLPVISPLNRGDRMNEEPINNEYRNRPSCWNCMNVFIHSEQGTKEFHCAIREKEPKVEPSHVCDDWE